jgi:hypothetical protein
MTNVGGARLGAGQARRRRPRIPEAILTGEFKVLTAYNPTYTNAPRLMVIKPKANIGMLATGW